MGYKNHTQLERGREKGIVQGQNVKLRVGTKSTFGRRLGRSFVSPKKTCTSHLRIGSESKLDSVVSEEWKENVHRSNQHGRGSHT